MEAAKRSQATADPNEIRGPALAGHGKPRILLMGQRRSGKSSISNVVFHKLPPQETLYLESTTRIQQDNMTSFMDFQIWDFPGQTDLFTNPTFDIDAILSETGSLIWVIDAQDDYLEAVSQLISTIIFLARHSSSSSNSNSSSSNSSNYASTNIEVFIHKIDGLSDEYKVDIQRDITLRIHDDLADEGLENAPVSFHATSIYDHSIYEALSKVVQKLMPRLGQLETMLTNLARTCRLDKVYLFDVPTKIYIATDSSPTDMIAYEVCSDFIDVIIDVTEIFGSHERSAEDRSKLEGPPWNQTLQDQVAHPHAEAEVVMCDGDVPLLLREVDKCLALVAIMKSQSEDKMQLVKMNVDTMAKGLKEFFEITRRSRGQRADGDKTAVGNGAGEATPA